MRDRWLAIRPYLLRWIGYSAFFTLCMFVFVYVTFPWDRLREAIIAQAEAPAAGRASNVELEIGSLGPTLWPGVVAHDVVYRVLPTVATERPAVMQMSRVTVHVGLFALLAQKLELDATILGMGGEVVTHLEQTLAGERPGLRALKMQFDHVDVGQVPQLVALVGLPMLGALTGSLELGVPEGRPEHATGNVDLHVNGLKIGDGHAQYQLAGFGGVTIAQINAGDLDVAIGIVDGVASIQRFQSSSNEFRLQSDGRIEVRNPLEQSTVNVGLRFQLTDVYRRKSEAAGRIMSVMDVVPELRSAKRADGLLGFRCRGTFERGVLCPPDSGVPGGRPRAR